ncbi:MAG: CoA transferase [Thermodesulfobacteriota bacterium]|nr:CoA transferase [Thermodesulfobacteriota bacterium]
MREQREKALGPYRVLDLTDEKGFLCGRIFAELGAEVIKVEPPGGDPARNKGPFYADTQDPEKSLFWFAYNAGKKGITLDIRSQEGKDILRRLVKGADFLIESFTPGHMEDLGLGYGDLEKINPRLIMTSITPFGQTGPYAHWTGPDIVPWALGGYMWMSGEPERAPLRISHPPQVYLHAGAMACVGSLMALFHRNRTGQGQHVDLSAQQCPVWMLTHTYSYWDLMKVNLTRQGGWRQFGQIRIKTLWPCKDGHITFLFLGGLIGAKGQRRLVELMKQDGMAPDWLIDFDWDSFDAFTATDEKLSPITDIFGKFFKTKTKAELLKEAVHSGIMLAPVNTVHDVLQDPHLKARDFWVEVEHRELGATITYPGPPCKMSETPWIVRGRAPLIGEHNEEICGKEHGLSDNEVVTPKQNGGHPGVEKNGPLDGIHILDFTSTVLGPTVTRYLADHGATVIKVESMAHPETLRLATPYAGNDPNINKSGYFAVYNASKLSLTLNMQKPKAREVARKLVEWADIVTESFVPGVMEKWGLSYQDVKKIKPNIIMASTCLQGQTGPYSGHRGYGQMVSAMAGWFELTGWPDSEPVGPYSAYTDWVDWNYLLLSILSALDYRDRTGKGQYIDQSQYESGLNFLVPAILDYTVNNRIAGRMGNRDPYAAPHGAYRCLGEDRWCVIAVSNDDEWTSFCEVTENPDWIKDPRFSGQEARKKNEDELDRLVEQWTTQRHPEDIMKMMQEKGVAAAVVQNAEDLFRDPQLQHRNHFVTLNHAEMGPHCVGSSVFKLSKCPNAPTSPAPLLGEHNEYVLKDILELSDDEIGDLVAEGVLE